MNDQEWKIAPDSLPEAGSATQFKSTMHLSARQITSSKHPFREWEHGPLSHLTGLAIPRPAADHGFRFSATGHLFDGLLSAKVYCDSLTGVSGNDRDQDPVVAHLVTSGRITYARKNEHSSATSGQILIRDTGPSWNFCCEPATRVRAVTIPRSAVLPRIGSLTSLNRAYIADVTAPEVRFLANFLAAVDRSSRYLNRSTTAQEIALDTCATLLSGILRSRSEQGAEIPGMARVRAAKNVIETHIDRHDLTPAMVARLVGIPLRTLHRSFSESDESIMAFIRGERLRRAHAELRERGSAVTVSEVAARWQFSDASHFIKHFKSAYGTTPAAYVKSRRDSS
ncbi:helix-turn-helix transcriptional regulator [Streptomyces sp. Root55]|uniref:helix-turn-helix transcriptional regulator n=1 Tax=Streptomyces sp. Root55 TaxID=1736554 RepID=UPI00099E6DFD|nr:helix-turn-helix transcriptional regulator [Streptomyces sp. Root55]